MSNTPSNTDVQRLARAIEDLRRSNIPKSISHNNDLIRALNESIKALNRLLAQLVGEKHAEIREAQDSAREEGEVPRGGEEDRSGGVASGSSSPSGTAQESDSSGED